MAKRNVADAAREALLPLVLETHSWGVVAAGTASQIVEAGLCLPIQFPEGRKRVGYIELPDDSKLWFDRQKGNTWRVRLSWPRAKRVQLERLQKLREERQRNLDCMVHDGEAWKTKEINRFCGLMNLHASFMRTDCGWRFSEKSTRRVASLLNRVRMVLLNAEVQLSEQARANFLAENALDDANQRVPMHRSRHLSLVQPPNPAKGLRS